MVVLRIVLWVVSRGDVTLSLHPFSVPPDTSDARPSWVALHNLRSWQEDMDEDDHQEHATQKNSTNYQNNPPHLCDEVYGTPKQLRVEQQIGQPQEGSLLIHKSAVVEEVTVTGEVRAWSTNLDVSSHLARHQAIEVFGRDGKGRCAHTIQFTAHVAGFVATCTLTVWEVQGQADRAIAHLNEGEYSWREGKKGRSRKI